MTLLWRVPREVGHCPKPLAGPKVKGRDRHVDLRAHHKSSRLPHAHPTKNKETLSDICPTGHDKWFLKPRPLPGLGLGGYRVVHSGHDQGQVRCAGLSMFASRLLRPLVSLALCSVEETQRDLAKMLAVSESALTDDNLPRAAEWREGQKASLQCWHPGGCL